MILERLLNRAKSITPEEQQIFSISNPSIAAMFGAHDSASGMVVNESTAMRLSAVYACVQLLSRVMAMTPLILYKDRGIGDKSSGKDRAVDHPLYNVLKHRAYSWMPAFQLKESMMMCNLLGGNSYAYIHRDRRGRCVGLQYMPHNYVTPKLNASRTEKEYEYRVNGKSRIFREDEILHVPGMGYDGIKGLSPLELAIDSVGRGLAVQEYGSKFFANGMNPSGVFEHPNALSEGAYNNLKADIDAKRGAGNSNATLILEEGMKYHPIAISPEQAQFIETMKFTVTDIARIYGIPPHMVGDLERATFSNIESQDINFVKYSMLAWFIRFEQFINLKCLTEEDHGEGYFGEFLVDNLLRGDSQARAKVFQAMRQNGVINADEWRERENWNEIGDGTGKAYLINGNMISLQTAIEQKAGGGNGSGGGKGEGGEEDDS